MDETRSNVEQQAAPMDLADRVITVIRKSVDDPIFDITLDTTFEELGLDSVDAVSITFAIEDEFNVDILDQGFIGLTHIGQIVDMLEKLLAQPASPGE